MMKQKRKKLKFSSSSPVPRRSPTRLHHVATAEDKLILGDDDDDDIDFGFLDE